MCFSPQAGKFPTMVTHADDLDEKVNVLKSTIKFQMKKVLCLNVAVGNIEMTDDQLMENIRRGKAESWKEYYRRYDYYLSQQQRLFGEDWQTPTDIIAEARNYALFGPETLGEHTALLERHQQPLLPLEMRI